MHFTRADSALCAQNSDPPNGYFSLMPYDKKLGCQPFRKTAQ
jgi:hypothetical protein